MPSYWELVNQVIRESDLIIEVLDARMVQETRNLEIEQKIARSGKRILYVLNKCDLADQKTLEKIKKELYPSVFISSSKKLGTTILKKKIMELSRGQPVVVGILGYPNVGKSSLINALSGRSAARTSPESGFTRALQKIRVDNKIVLFDTPGVFPWKEKDSSKHTQTGAISYSKVKDAEEAALHLFQEKKELLKEHYALQASEPEDLLEELARKWKKLTGGGRPDLEATSRILLKEWQTGKIKF